MKYIIYIYLFLVFFMLSFKDMIAQKEADRWITGYYAGLNFDSGDPVTWYPVIPQNSTGFHNGTVMSDSLGNLLFFSNSVSVWNRLSEIMENGDNILPGHYGGTQRAVAFPMPGNSYKYYLFTVSNAVSPLGMYYSIIDMSQNGGIGAVVQKNILLEAASMAHDKLFVAKNRSNTGYWVISRLYDDDRYISFLVDGSGVHEEQIPQII